MTKPPNDLALLRQKLEGIERQIKSSRKELDDLTARRAKLAEFKSAILQAIAKHTLPPND